MMAKDLKHLKLIVEKDAPDLPAKSKAARRILEGDSVSLTREEAASFMVKLAAPGKGETVFDPCCGSGSLLVLAGKAGKTGALYGQDKSESSVSFAADWLKHNGFDGAQIKKGDALGPPVFKNEKGERREFDLVISEIPLGSNWSRTGKNGFISVILESCAPKGRAVVMTNTAVLFALPDREMRKRALPGIDAVISLPPNVFYRSRVSGCILVLKKGRRNKDVLFIDCGDWERAEEAAAVYRERKTVKGLSALVSLDNIDENCNLSPGLYIEEKTPKNAPVRDLASVNADIRRLETEIAKLSRQIEEAL